MGINIVRLPCSKVKALKPSCMVNFSRTKLQTLHAGRTVLSIDMRGFAAGNCVDPRNAGNGEGDTVDMKYTAVPKCTLDSPPLASMACLADTLLKLCERKMVQKSRTPAPPKVVMDNMVGGDRMSTMIAAALIKQYIAGKRG